MHKIHRSGALRRMIRRYVFGSDKRYFVSGDRACRAMMRTAARRRRREPDPEEESILAWARFDLMRETIGGFWEQGAVHAA